MTTKLVRIGVMALLMLQAPWTVAEGLEFDEAIRLALEQDPELRAIQSRQKSFIRKSEAALALPDPSLTASISNLSTDEWELGAEPMTQLRFGISQRMPRGDSRSINSRRMAVAGDEQIYTGEARKAQIQHQVGQLWLDLYLTSHSINLIESSRGLFEQLGEIVEVNYASTLGKTRQQDVIRSQLELTRLEDRLLKLQQQASYQTELLRGWIAEEGSWTRKEIVLGDLPELEFASALTVSFNRFMQHPLLQRAGARITGSELAVDLARQAYKPSWGFNASYGYRVEDPQGRNRADLLTVGVTWSMPLFDRRQQDNGVEAAIAMAEAKREDRSLLARQLHARYQAAQQQLQYLNKRESLYSAQLLNQVHEQAEATLTAYTNDDGDFEEVVRARIAELDAELAALEISVRTLQTRLELNYLLTGTEYSS